LGLIEKLGKLLRANVEDVLRPFNICMRIHGPGGRGYREIDDRDTKARQA